jgi:fatty acid desaturase
MFERIKKWWNTPQPCPVCGNAIAEGKSKKPTDRKELWIATRFYLLAVLLMAIWMWVYLITFFEPVPDMMVPYLFSGWFFMLLGMIILRLFDKVGLHTARAYDTKSDVRPLEES